MSKKRKIDNLTDEEHEIHPSMKLCIRCHLLLDAKKFVAYTKRTNKEGIAKVYEYQRSYCNSCRNTK
jgi:hypothetical protein